MINFHPVSWRSWVRILSGTLSFSNFFVTRWYRIILIINEILPYFSQSELHYIYTQQLEKHFIIHVAAQSQHNASDSSSQEAAEGQSQRQGSGDQDKAMRDLLSAISHVTVELQDHLRGMFLPTSQRCHYMFTMTDLTMVFRWVHITRQLRSRKKASLPSWKTMK